MTREREMWDADAVVNWRVVAWTEVRVDHALNDANDLTNSDMSRVITYNSTSEIGRAHV